MAAEAPQGLHPLDVPRPGFLDCLATDPGRAAADFCDFAYRLLSSRPPRIFLAVDPDRRADLLQEVLLHCVAGGCRVLQSYEDRGRPFASWLIVVAANKARDILRRSGDAMAHAETFDVLPEFATEPEQADPIAAKCVLSCLSRMSEKCQLLLRLLADDLKPGDMVEPMRLLLGRAAYTNKQASDDLRHCKQMFHSLLLEAGIDPSAV